MMTHLFRGAIVGAHNEAVVIHVKDDVLPHDGEANQGNVSDGLQVRHLVLGADDGHGRLLGLVLAGPAFRGAEADAHCKR